MTSPESAGVALSMDSAFVFPPQHPTAGSNMQESSLAESTRRPVSMRITLPPQGMGGHKRSVTALPKFSFNSSDTSGLQDEDVVPAPSEENVPLTPSRRGHRRRASEFVGGDVLRGTTTMVSSSPTKETSGVTLMPSSAPPTTRRGHAHRRSAAMSSHDVGSIMQSPDFQPRQSSSLPSSPLDHPAQLTSFNRAMSAPDVHPAEAHSVSSSSDQESERPSSRRVGFSEAVEFIPRPLSTISSETESSTSTVIAHSVNNSISSVLSLGGATSPSARSARGGPAKILADDAKGRSKSSLEISRRIEREGEWLKGRPSQSSTRPSLDSGVATLRTTFAAPGTPTKRPNAHKRKATMGHSLGFDRRRSEPSIGGSPGETSRLSTISLQDSSTYPHSSDNEKPSADMDQRKSTKKIKTWALGKLTRKPKDLHRPLPPKSNSTLVRPASAGDVPVPGKVPVLQVAAAETNLDTVFSSDYTISTSQRPATPSHPRIEISAASPTQATQEDEPDLLDLDDARPSSTSATYDSSKQRKDLHSSRLNKDFGGPGMHYHRRADSAPTLSPSDVYKQYATSQFGGITKVFEEDEDEDSASQYSQSDTTPSALVRDIGVGIHIVDSDDSVLAPRSTNGLGVEREYQQLLESPSFATLTGLGMTTVQTVQHPSSTGDATAEEPATVGAVEVVEACVEPRATSLEKSSNSSDTPTVVGAQSAVLALPESQQSIMTPDTYQTSAFSSPDLARRQGSFDASRLGTSASSIADNRTMSSCVTSEHPHSIRVSVDDVPSLTSSRSTMLSTVPAHNMQRDVSAHPTPSASSVSLTSNAVSQRRQKRSSIQSLSQFVGSPFGSKSKVDVDDETGPQTAADVASGKTLKKKEHRLKKLMFWKPKCAQQAGL